MVRWRRPGLPASGPRLLPGELALTAARLKPGIPFARSTSATGKPIAPSPARATRTCVGARMLSTQASRPAASLAGRQVDRPTGRTARPGGQADRNTDDASRQLPRQCEWKLQLEGRSPHRRPPRRRSPRPRWRPPHSCRWHRGRAPKVARVPLYRLKTDTSETVTHTPVYVMPLGLSTATSAPRLRHGHGAEDPDRSPQHRRCLLARPRRRCTRLGLGRSAGARAERRRRRRRRGE